MSKKLLIVIGVVLFFVGLGVYSELNDEDEIIDSCKHNNHYPVSVYPVNLNEEFESNEWIGVIIRLKCEDVLDGFIANFSEEEFILYDKTIGTVTAKITEEGYNKINSSKMVSYIELEEDLVYNIDKVYAIEKNEEEVCEQGGGKRKLFSGCGGDDCSGKFMDNLICGTESTYRCDCGVFKCWDGEDCVFYILNLNKS